MKRLLVLVIVSLMLSGCIAVPVYDSGYYPYPYHGPYPYYGYVRPDVTFFFISGPHGHGFRGGHGFHGGRR